MEKDISFDPYKRFQKSKVYFSIKQSLIFSQNSIAFALHWRVKIDIMGFVTDIQERIKTNIIGSTC